MLNLCALLLACAALQAPSVPPAVSPAPTPAPTPSDEPAKLAPKAEPEWLDLDRVVLIVNEDIITYRQMVRELKHEMETRNINNQSERQAAQNRILTRRVKALLFKQAGQDMGADEQLVERRVQDSLDRIIARQNGVVGMSKLMQSKDVDTREVKKELREELYSQTFMDSVTGLGAGVSDRPNRDRYVRPGALKFRHERALRDPELLRQIGGSTEMVTLQTLMLDSDKNGGRDKTLELARDLHDSIETGTEDMSDLVRRHSMYKANDGVGESVEIARLRQFDPELAKFIDARPADPELWTKYVSEPFNVGESETRVVVRLARIREVKPGSIPPLASNKTQEQIAKQAQESLEDYRLDRAFMRLHAAAYVWPSEQDTPQQR